MEDDEGEAEIGAVASKGLLTVDTATNTTVPVDRAAIDVQVLPQSTPAMVSQEDLLDSTSAYGEGQRKNTKRLEPTLEMSLTKQKTKARTTTAICDGAVK